VSGVEEKAFDKDKLVGLTAQLVGSSIDRFEFIDGGRNNIVGRAHSNGRTLLVKSYFNDVSDIRARLYAEFHMLQFLWGNGLRCIPEPIIADWDHNIKPSAGEIVERDVLCLADMLLQMWALKDQDQAIALPVASEACFSIADYSAVIERRIEKLLAHIEHDDSGLLARQFISEDISRIFAAVRQRPGNCDISEEPLPVRQRTLSPSDHGFHNAIKVSGANWVFLDFEYAGWDDPAKMLADACLQPAVPVIDDFRKPFFRHALEGMGDCGLIRQRLEAIYPLVGLKWCLIMMNEFIPVSQRRRHFSRRGLIVDRRNEQLLLAQRALRKVERDMRDRDLFSV
jgi:hypothetical protein